MSRIVMAASFAFVLWVAVRGLNGNEREMKFITPTCAWGRDTECCIQPPRIPRWTLADVRAERWRQR